MIHVGEPRTLFDYSQESGRAGKNGKMSQVMVIRDRMKGQSHEKSHMDVNRQLVKGYLDAACRRVVAKANMLRSVVAPLGHPAHACHKIPLCNTNQSSWTRKWLILAVEQKEITCYGPTMLCALHI